MDRNDIHKGTQLRTIKPHFVDQDDDDTERYATEGDEAEVISVDCYAGQLVFGVGFPASGASGFYDFAEVVDHFEIGGAT